MDPNTVPRISTIANLQNKRPALHVVLEPANRRSGQQKCLLAVYPPQFLAKGNAAIQLGTQTLEDVSHQVCGMLADPRARFGAAQEVHESFERRRVGPVHS